MSFFIGQQFGTPLMGINPLMGNQLRRIPSSSELSQISQFQSVPVQPIPTQINFYDRITGQAGPSVNLFDRTTQIYNSNGMSVEVSGTQQNVEKAISLMRLNEMHPQQAVQQDVLYPIDADISDLLGVNKNGQQTVQQVGQQVVPQNMVLGGVPMGQQFGNVSTWTFVPNPLNQSKVLLTHQSLVKPFSGSGVMFFERNYGVKNEPCVILVKSTKGTFEDFGGEMSRTLTASADAVKHNARKETFEESEALFAIQNLDLDRRVNGEQMFNDMIDTTNNATYRCYYVALTGTNTHPLDQLYANNRNIILTRIPNVPNDWRETIEIKRFYLSSIRTALGSTPHGGIMCNDVNNVASTIRDRTANSLRVLLRNDRLLQAVFNNPVNANYDKDNSVYSQTFGLVRFNI
jgi:hypothetical protein